MFNQVIKKCAVPALYFWVTHEGGWRRWMVEHENILHVVKRVKTLRGPCLPHQPQRISMLISWPEKRIEHTFY